MVLSPDGDIVACGSQDNSVHFWRRSTEEDSMMSGYPGKPSALAFDDTGTLLATGGGEAVTVWSFQGSSPEGTRPGVLELESPYEDGVALAGLGVFLVILLHKPLDAYSIVSMMKYAGHSQRARTWTNVGFAMLCPVVALASFGGVELLGPKAGTVIGYVLSFAAGAFLCIALSDLLPEIHSHSHDRGKLIVSLLVGISLAYVL